MFLYNNYKFFLKIMYILIALIAIVIVLYNYASPNEKTLYDRLGGVYAIAAVVNHFSDNLITNPVVGQNSKNVHLRDWHRNQLARLPGLKFLRTLWVCAATGGPYTYVGTKTGKCPMSLENAHSKFHITPDEFDAVAMELTRSLDHFNVPSKEKNEVLAAFAAHKAEINNPTKVISCPFS